MPGIQTDMPVRPEKRGNRWRIVEPDGSLATTDNGKPRDGGGHKSKGKALAQARAINQAVKDGDKRRNHAS